MQAITSATGLRDAIIALESKRKKEEVVLREQLQGTYESIKPINIIKTTYTEIVASQDLKEDLINTSVGLTAGYISKVLFEEVSHSPLRKMIGTALLFGITNTVRNNPDTVKSIVKGFINILRSNSSKRIAEKDKPDS